MAEEIRLRIDLDAPIIPGEGAAGLQLGRPITDYFDPLGTRFEVNENKNPYIQIPTPPCWRYRSDAVRVSTKNDTIDQIGVLGDYQGTIDCRIRLGDTVSRLLAEYGPIGEDDEDNLVAASLPGMCFELPEDQVQGGLGKSYTRPWLDAIRESPITEFFVFSAACPNGCDLRDRPDPTRCPTCGLIVLDILDLEPALDVSLYKQIPLSGSVPERWYDAHGSCIWVRFAPEGQPEWAGVFGRGLNGGYIQAVPFADRRTAMVIAGGQGYIIDAHTGELLHKTDHDLFCDAITIPFHDFVIACDYTQLFAVSRLGVIWQSPRLALDEIKLDYAMQRTMSGQAMHLDGWQDFWLTYQAWQLCAKPLKHR